MTKIMIEDCHAICHAAKHTLKGLSYKEQETGIIYGFLTKLLSLQKKLKATHIVFAWDSSKSKRKEIYPEYKEKRYTAEKTEEEIELEKIARPQFGILRKEILPALGFKNNFVAPGLEADDIIASITQNTRKKCFIISRDKDLYQLLSPFCSMFDPQTNEIITDAKFEKKYGICPTLWGKVKSIAGCPTDCVRGIERVGESTAIKYLLNNLNPQTKTYQNIQEGIDVIKRNRKLVVLPFKGTKKFDIKKGTGIDFNQFIFMCDKYGLGSFLKKKTFRQWKEAFGAKKKAGFKRKKI